MYRVCILTDSTAQFPNGAFPGQDLVYLIPFRLHLNGQTSCQASDVALEELPATALHGLRPRLLAPPVDEIRNILGKICHKHNEIIAILSSQYLTPGVAFAEELARQMRGKAGLRVIDSNTTSVGLGLLVQQAARAAFLGTPATEIVRQISGMIPKVYTLFYAQNLSYLYHAGLVDPGQAVIGEMLEISPLLILENGRPAFIRKIRSSRQLTDSLQEFVAEFEKLEHLSLIHGNHSYRLAMRNLSSRLFNAFPQTVFSQQKLSNSLATILGPCSLGLVALEA